MSYLSSVVKEGKKVKWTSKDALAKLTFFTLVVVTLYAIFFVFVDMLIANFLKLITGA